MTSAMAMFLRKLFVRAAKGIAASGSRIEEARALKDRGNAYVDTGNVEQGRRCYEEAVRLWPGFAEAYANLGILEKNERRYIEAESLLGKAISIKPDLWRAQLNLGIVFQETGETEQALRCYHEAIAINPDDSTAYFRIGLLHIEQGAYDAAASILENVLKRFPYDVAAYGNLALVFRRSGEYGSAERLLRRAIALIPGNSKLLGELGETLRLAGRYVEADACIGSALELEPGNLEALVTKGLILHAYHHRYEEAITCYRRILQTEPGNINGRWNLGLVTLALGNCREGWELLECRLSEGHILYPHVKHLRFPRWKGESLAGKSVIIWAEQGLGDEIQFCRYVPLLKLLGAATVTLTCKPPLMRLFRQIEGVDTLLPLMAPAKVPTHDYWLATMSFPYAMRDVYAPSPMAIPYLAAEPRLLEKWRACLPTGGRRVGLVWKGNPRHLNDRDRSLADICVLAPLWGVKGVNFISLQKMAGEEEGRNPPPSQPLTHVGSDMEDFAEAAAIISNLDLLICVDTAFAHLAGALGKPCWVLLPWIGTDFRWLAGRDDSPWYPGVMRLYNQPAPNDWASVVKRVEADLAQWVREFAVDGQD